MFTYKLQYIYSEDGEVHQEIDPVPKKKIKHEPDTNIQSCGVCTKSHILLNTIYFSICHHLWSLCNDCYQNTRTKCPMCPLDNTNESIKIYPQSMLTN